MLNPKTSFLFQHDRLMCHSETTQSDSESYDIEGHEMLNKFFRILTKRTIETKAICVSLSAVAQHDKLSAFTLSEVLITIGILGVVAALTIPNLMQTMQNRDLVSKYLKVHNTISNAYKDAEALTGFKLNNLSPDNFKYRLSDSLNLSLGNCEGEVCLSDGSSFDYVCTETTEDEEGKCTQLLVDTNGKKKPNSAGKDRFRFLITEHGLVAQGESSDYCGLIDDGLDCGRYILAHHKLFDGLINNCSTYTDGRCTGCDDGYSLEENTCHKVNLANCDKYKGVSCRACKAGYMLKEGVCTSLKDNNCSLTTDGETCDVCSDKYKNSDGTCEEIDIAECTSYKGDNCKTCKDGYKNNGTECTKLNIEGCTAYTGESCKTYKTIENCKTQSAYTCTACKDGYYLSGNSCPAQNVQNCNSYTANANTCTECKSGYYANDGQCVAQNVENCDAYNANANTCKTCKSGYYLSNGACVKGFTDMKTATNGTKYYTFSGTDTSQCEKYNLRLPTSKEITTQKLFGEGVYFIGSMVYCWNYQNNPSAGGSVCTGGNSELLSRAKLVCVPK